MVSLPKDVLAEVVRNIGKNDFRDLGPFLLSGRDDRETWYEDEVLREANLEEFINSQSKGNIGTIYRPIFEKCLNAGNRTTQYFEGLRLVIKIGPSDESIALMHKADEHVEYAKFAVGVFSICYGKYKTCKITLDDINSPNLVRRLGETFMRQLYVIGPRLLRLYEDTVDFPEEDIPGRSLRTCYPTNPCLHCFI